MSEFLDLPLVPMEDLIKEIESRCETFVCAYELPDDKQKRDVFNTYFGKGNRIRACALANVLSNDCLNNWNGELKTLQRINEDEEC